MFDVHFVSPRRQKKIYFELDYVYYNYNLHLHLERGVAAVPSIVLEGHEEDRGRILFFGMTIVDDRFNSLEIVAEEKFVFSFGTRRRR